jgi:hypothetical protein
MELETKIAAQLIGRTVEDLSRYMGVYQHMKQLFAKVSGTAAEIRSPYAFWQDVLADRFVDGPSDRPHLVSGQTVTLNDFFLSEWAPKMPGQVWTDIGAQTYQDALKRVGNELRIGERLYQTLLPFGKQSVIQAGYGSIRLNPTCNPDSGHMFMSATTADHWHCDLGIPIVVSRAVYTDFLRYAQDGAPWMKRASGTLVLNRDLPFQQVVPQAIGNQLSAETQDLLTKWPMLPKCYVHLGSPMAVQFCYNDSHPDCTAWSMYELTDEAQRYNAIKVNHQFTYTRFDPSQEDDVHEAVAFLQEYARSHGAARFITDFDGQVPRLQATIPLDADPLEALGQPVRSLAAKLDIWAKNVLPDLRKASDWF